MGRMYQGTLSLEFGEHTYNMLVQYAKDHNLTSVEEAMNAIIEKTLYEFTAKYGKEYNEGNKDDAV